MTKCAVPTYFDFAVEYTTQAHTHAHTQTYTHTQPNTHTHTPTHKHTLKHTQTQTQNTYTQKQEQETSKSKVVCVCVCVCVCATPTPRLHLLSGSAAIHFRLTYIPMLRKTGRGPELDHWPGIFKIFKAQRLVELENPEVLYEV